MPVTSALAPGVLLRTGDLGTAFGFRGYPGRTAATVEHLRRHNIGKYADEVEEIRQLPVFGQGSWHRDSAAPGEATDGIDAKTDRRRMWKSYTVEDVLWMDFFRHVRDVLGDHGPFAQVHAAIHMNELQAHGKLPGTEALSFQEYLTRFFFGGQEPYLAVVHRQANEPPLAEQWEQEVPDNAVISDNPSQLHDLIERRLLPYGGALSVVTFRSSIQPAMARLRELSRQGQELPPVPDPVHVEARLLRASPEEYDVLSLIRSTKNISPDVHLKVKGGRIQQVDYTESWSPGRFKPAKALAQDSTIAVTSHPDQDGKLRNYTVKKRLAF